MVTMHRPSNVDDESTLRGIVGALERINRTLPIVFPVHPRTRRRFEEFGLDPALRLIEPTGYLDSICLQSNAALVLTDSGGIQEETTALGVPCLTLRHNTERPITVSEGTNTVVGTDPAAIERAASLALEHPTPARRPALWDGRAAQRIVTILGDAMGTRPPRPTDTVR